MYKLEGITKKQNSGHKCITTASKDLHQPIIVYYPIADMVSLADGEASALPHKFSTIEHKIDTNRLDESVLWASE